ncbi:MAG: hypothetical protein IPM29_09745 [Planctomycetes bacterium]|nr:hypothetical protein [Planctomycetota bacterium]
MSFRSSLQIISAALFATLSTLSAQHTLTLRGELDEGRSTGCYYCPAVPYTVMFSETPVRSATVDLAYYKALSAQLILTGFWDTSRTPAGLEVTGVVVVTESLSFPTSARTGGTERFVIHGPAGAFGATLFALGNGFTPALGTALLIDPATTVVLDSGLLDGQGTLRSDVPIPAHPALVGLRFWTQAVIAPAGGVPYTSNPGRTLIDR